MVRWLYQLTLVALQLAFLLELAPPLAEALRRGATFSAFADSALGVVQLAASLAAVGGGALALAFPLLVLNRHRQRGRSRFGGLPRWAIALALAGGVVFVLGALLNLVAPLLAADVRIAAVLTAQPILNAGLAVMAAGVLCAELLRRSVGVPRVVVVPSDTAAHRIEVTHPPELATQAA